MKELREIETDEEMYKDFAKEYKLFVLPYYFGKDTLEFQRYKARRMLKYSILQIAYKLRLNYVFDFISRRVKR